MFGIPLLNKKSNKDQKLLVLVRHATAVAHEDFAKDFDRQLDPISKVEIDEVGKKLASLKISPNLAIASTAVRTTQTAHQLASYIGLDSNSIKFDKALYNASYKDILKIVEGIDNERDCAVIVGHNPGISQLASYLTTEKGGFQLPTCGVVVIGFENKKWQEISEGSGKAKHFFTP